MPCLNQPGRRGTLSVHRPRLDKCGVTKCRTVSRLLYERRHGHCRERRQLRPNHADSRRRRWRRSRADVGRHPAPSNGYIGILGRLRRRIDGSSIAAWATMARDGPPSRAPPWRARCPRVATYEWPEPDRNSWAHPQRRRAMTAAEEEGLPDEQAADQRLRRIGRGLDIHLSRWPIKNAPAVRTVRPSRQPRGLPTGHAEHPPGVQPSVTPHPHRGRQSLAVRGQPDPVRARRGDQAL
jgi:hypothetical protein